MTDKTTRLVVGAPRETFPGERRVAAVPSTVPSLIKAGFEVLVEAGAGAAAGFPDAEYRDQGASIASSRREVFEAAGCIVQVRGLGANPEAGRADLELTREGQIVIGLMQPYTARAEIEELARRGLVVLAMELMPRITRAQSMDALSSMATVAGYRAVVVAAAALPRMFPMLMTAAGTVAPARVLVLGAGVAGLQAISTARRLGAVVTGYDIRPAAREQIESLGARFLELPLEAAGAEAAGGYARAVDESFQRRQQLGLARAVAESDIVIAAAAVPGKPAPVLVTGAMVSGMRSGSVIVDLVTDRGGNCELARGDRTVVEGGVTIIGLPNAPAEVPYHASQLYARNIAQFLLYLAKDGRIVLDGDDPIRRETLVARGGAIVNPAVRGAAEAPAT